MRYHDRPPPIQCLTSLSLNYRTTKDQNFCRNEYNVTGLCNRQSCPLANSQYATVRSDASTGALYLYIRTAERAHLPSKWWERIRLSKDYGQALAQLDDRLIYWPKFLIHKCKQRLTRLTQVAIRTRRLAKEQERLGEELVPRLAPKIRRREATRERKAEAAAKIDRAIERELVERLRSGAYGDQPLNVEQHIWKKVLRGLERDGKASRDVDLDEGISEDEDEEDEEGEKEDEWDGQNVEFVSGSEFEESDDENVNDLEDWFDSDDEAGSDDADSDDNDDSEDEDEDDSDSDDSDDDKPAPKKSTKTPAKTPAKVAGLKRKATKPPPKKPTRKGDGKGPRVEIEYESERAPKRLATTM